MEDNVLVDGRIAAFTIKDADLKVYMNASPQERARRVASRDDISVDDALRFNTVREASEKKRYMDYYGIDPDDLTTYDLVVNTDVWDASGVATIIASGILALMED
jgi:cytidylate kinase